MVGLEVVTTLNSDKPIWNIMLDAKATSYLTMMNVPVVDPMSLR